jgi:hypothetical protein
MHLRRTLLRERLPLIENLRRMLRTCVTDLIASLATVALIGDTLKVTRLLLCANRRRPTRACVADLVDAWGHCGTNRKHTLFDGRLLFDAPMAFLVANCILELAKIW